MHRRDEYRNRVELLQGTLDLIILQTLQYGRKHGYGISQAIKAGSKDLFLVDTGSLYPALHRMEKRGWVRSEWDLSEHKQRAKFYQLTAAGRRQLTQERSRWSLFVGAMSSLMKSPENEV